MATSCVMQIAASRCAPSDLKSAASVCLRGQSLPVGLAAPAIRSVNARGLQIVSMAGKKKVITNLNDWKKEFIGYGIFVEDSESAPVNIIKSVEQKKLLSGVEKSGLLSKLESLGLSLSKIEELGLLSKAEDLGLLSLAENVATTPPGVFASAALPLLVAAIAVPIAIPDDTLALELVQYSLAAVLALASVASFGTSILLSVLLD